MIGTTTGTGGTTTGGTTAGASGALTDKGAAEAAMGGADDSEGSVWITTLRTFGAVDTGAPGRRAPSPPDKGPPPPPLPALVAAGALPRVIGAVGTGGSDAALPPPTVNVDGCPATRELLFDFLSWQKKSKSIPNRSADATAPPRTPGPTIIAPQHATQPATALRIHDRSTQQIVAYRPAGMYCPVRQILPAAAGAVALSIPRLRRSHSASTSGFVGLLSRLPTK